MAKKDTIGVTACMLCGNLTELKVDSSRAVYVKCYGNVEGRKCGFTYTYPTPESVKTLAAAARDGWLGPIPYGYFPLTTEQGNPYGHVLDNIDYETRRETPPYVVRYIERGARPVPPPQPEPRPEPAAPPKPAEPVGGAKPKRRFL